MAAISAKKTFEDAAFTLRRAISEAELLGAITSAEAIKLIDAINSAEITAINSGVQPQALHNN